ncbi:MAG: holo-[acyl-carrier-protein] synthase [Clostridiales bacterium]|nr:holo-[acyl-carrier-protein] synthase [Clostridiales bacterium]
MLGIDILEVERIEKQISNENFISKVFTQNEINYVNQFKNKAEHYAGFFCAKESVMKALEDCKQMSMTEIEVNHKPNGKPYVKLFGKALEVFEKTNFKTIEISISQTKTYATAVAMLV